MPVTGATPEQRVELYRSPSLGASLADACQGGALGLDRGQWVATTWADASGMATFDVFVEAGFSGTTLHHQAIDALPCVGTNVDSATLP